MAEDSALMVIDVQTAFMEPVPMETVDGPDLLEKCGRLIEAARSAGVPVIHIRHVPPESNGNSEALRFCPEVQPDPEEAVVDKTFSSAFLRTTLDDVLTSRGIRRLYVCGLATFGCVNQTVMCALCREYDVVVVSDGHGARPLGGTVPELIENFNRTWERAGATLSTAASVCQEFAA
jgi:nicotinamidase-related amidase